MTKITIGTNRFAVILSWLIALVCCIGIILFLRLTPSSAEQGKITLPDKENKQTHKRGNQKKKINQKIKKSQSQRALPPNYSKQLVSQSEVLIKKDLQTRLERFQEMSQKMSQRKDVLLNQVESRTLPKSAPKDANNTSQARNIPKAGNPPLGPNPSIEDFYNMLRQYETEIQKNHLAVNAARQSLEKGQSFPEVYNSLKLGLSNMPSFDELISRQVDGGEWARSQHSNASANLEIKSTADLNNYRGLLGQASRQSGLAGTRLERLFGIQQPGGGEGSEGGSNSQGEGDGGDGDGGGMGVNYKGDSGRKLNQYAGTRLNEEMVKAQALPGRRFSKNADREGWLYINTWYMIGPWDNYGRDDFVIVHPPELSVDFDAVYTNGQVTQGVAETDSHPLMIIGDTINLDGTLRWKFMQSESMHNTVPVTTDNSTYYAYTELYFDEATTMLVAIGTDDSGRIWINGKDVWQDSGSSWYYIDEHISPFEFQQGWNTVLVRLENIDGATGFSFLIIPPDSSIFN